MIPKVQAQCTAALKINEILVINEDNFIDDYGKRSPWIEIYNSASGTVNIAGCFLTNDINEPRKYMVPKGDILTKIKPRQHILFWADNITTHGTFHLNFTLNPDEANFIALFDSDGKTLIDSVTIPVGQRANISYGLVEDGWDQKRLEKEIKLNSSYKSGNKLWVYYEKVTPNSNNRILDANSKIDNLEKNDNGGVGMTLTAMSVVFGGLIVLYLIFKVVGRVAILLSTRRTILASGITKEELKNIAQPSGEIFAAIAMAIYEATEMHDEENTIITIKNTARNYSPWNSKIYMLRETPSKK
nr:OadG family transporter subunit [Candidatus Azobacteroides pseudotrichonymphae]